MSLPRQIIPGATYFVTRRCTQQLFLLNPSAAVLEVFLYCLAVAASRTGVVVHAAVVMSNHYHLVVTDPLGRLPEFYGWLNEFVAKALNSKYKRKENLWSSDQTNVVRLEDAAAVLDKVAYSLANPVVAGLVPRGEQWPGVRLCGPFEKEVARPGWFFRPEGPTPATATLVLTSPPIGAASDEEATARIERLVCSREARVRRKFKATGRSFLGRRAVLAQRITDSPWVGPRAPSLVPRFATRSKQRRLEALQRCRSFASNYSSALRAWCAGVRDVVFPAGTYKMARVHGVRVADS